VALDQVDPMDRLWSAPALALLQEQEQEQEQEQVQEPVQEQVQEQAPAPAASYK
jgi:hypothetical protein